MSLINPARMRTVAAGGVLALAAGSLGALAAAPANAASEPLTYTCTDPLGSTHEFSVTADTDAPDQVEVGQSFTPTITATVTVPADLRELLYGIGARTVEGDVDDGGSPLSSIGFDVDGTPGSVPADIPVIEVPETGGLEVVATAMGTPVTPSAAGTVTLSAGDFTAVLAGKDEAGGATLLSPYTIPCVLDADQDATVDTVTVVEDGTPSGPTPECVAAENASAAAATALTAAQTKQKKAQTKQKKLRKKQQKVKNNLKKVKNKAAKAKKANKKAKFKKLRKKQQKTKNNFKKVKKNFKKAKNANKKAKTEVAKAKSASNSAKAAAAAACK